MRKTLFAILILALAMVACQTPFFSTQASAEDPAVQPPAEIVPAIPVQQVDGASPVAPPDPDPPVDPDLPEDPLPHR